MMAGYVLNVIHFLEGFNRLNTRKIEHVRDTINKSRCLTVTELEKARNFADLCFGDSDKKS